MNQTQRLALLSEIYARRSAIIEGKFSSTFTKTDKMNHWQELWRCSEINGYPFVRADRDCSWLRDTVSVFGSSRTTKTVQKCQYCSIAPETFGFLLDRLSADLQLKKNTHTL